MTQRARHSLVARDAVTECPDRADPPRLGRRCNSLHLMSDHADEPARLIAALAVREAALEELPRIRAVQEAERQRRDAQERATAEESARVAARQFRIQRVLLATGGAGAATILVMILAGVAAHSGWAALFIGLILGSSVPVVPLPPDEGGWILWVPLSLATALGIVVGVVVTSGAALLAIAVYGAHYGLRAWRSSRATPSQDRWSQPVDLVPWRTWLLLALLLLILFATHA